MNSTFKLSISLVNTNNKLLLGACLRSLQAVREEVPFEIILVDNVSTDGSAEMVRTEFPEVQLLVNEARRGFGANHNQAINKATGEYILVLNEDTIVKPGALKAMCDYLDRDASSAAVGCRLENPDGSLQRSCYKFPSPGRALAENLLLVAAFPSSSLWGDYRSWDHNESRYVDFVSGAAIMVRRKVVEQIGAFDERFFIYAEETDWCYRMHRAGWKVAFTPSGTIVHYGGQSSVKVKDKQFSEFNRSALKYMRKHYGLSGAFSQVGTMLIGSLVRIPLWSLVYLTSSQKRESARAKVSLWWKMLFWAIGWRGPGLDPRVTQMPLCA